MGVALPLLLQRSPSKLRDLVQARHGQVALKLEHGCVQGIFYHPLHYPPPVHPPTSALCSTRIHSVFCRGEQHPDGDIRLRCLLKLLHDQADSYSLAVYREMLPDDMSDPAERDYFNHLLDTELARRRAL